MRDSGDDPEDEVEVADVALPWSMSQRQRIVLPPSSRVAMKRCLKSSELKSGCSLDSPTVVAQVGHSDGMGPNQSTAGALSSWNSAHANQNCANTAPRGGAGRIYCFAR